MKYWMGLMLFVLVGCTSTMYGRKPTKNQAESWGCNYPNLIQTYEEDQAQLTPGYVRTPQIGWTMCTILAKIGHPGQVGQVYRSAYGASVNFYYRIPGDGVATLATEGTIRFEKKPGMRDWIVVSISGF